MNQHLTVAFLTARKQSHADWFLDSLESQIGDYPVSVIIISFADFVGERNKIGKNTDVMWTHPKPNVWQGPHRRTPRDYWAKSAYINTAMCLAKDGWLACVDDRCVLMPLWLDSINEAMHNNYAVCGAYEKHINMKVENGVIQDWGETIGVDKRVGHPDRAIPCPGSSFFGCHFALPIEWALTVNGADESCDSLGLEDCIFGGMLRNNGFELRYDQRMKVIQDRTQGDEVCLVKRTDKGISPYDKSHRLLKRVRGKLSSTHHWNFRDIRERVQRGEPFPVPVLPDTDWFDNQKLSQFP